jgi:RAT1-interacting protein
VGTIFRPTLKLCHARGLKLECLLSGYKFETLSTIPAPWGETSRDYIENRENEVVNNKEQYCSVVRTGVGKSIVCLGGEVDASE